MVIKMATRFISVIKREHSDYVTYIIDGYSTAKSIRGMAHDIARAVKKYDEGEAEVFASMRTNKDVEDSVILPEHSDGGYFFYFEETPIAVRFDEETDEMEEATANFYFCVRFSVEIESENCEESKEEKNAEDYSENLLRESCNKLASNSNYVWIEKSKHYDSLWVNNTGQIIVKHNKQRGG